MKKTRIFEGVGTALITPLSGGKIDYECLGRLIEMQISGGVDCIVIGGTTGEAATLTAAERYRLFAFARERIDRRCRLVFGTGTNDTKVAIEHTKKAYEIGCDGVLLVTPYYNKGTEEGVYKHYESIAKCADLPIILYNVPSRTGVNLGFGLLERLAKIDTVAGIKEASDSADRLVSLAAFGDELPLYAGNDSQIYTALALGGAGVISVASNIFPEMIKRITADYFGGDVGKSLDMQLKLLPFIRTLFIETNPAPIKHAMKCLGLCSGEVRLPLDVPRESTMAAVECELKRLSQVG